jgi:hypothetical protein
MLMPGDCEKFMFSDEYRELLSLGIILAAVVFFSNYALSYAQELPTKTDSISDITSEIAIPTTTSSVQQQIPHEQFITPGLSSRGDRDNSIRNLPLETETQEKQQDEYSDDGNTDSEDQEEIPQDERVNEEENNNRQNNNDIDDNNNNIHLEFPIPFP